MNRFNTQSACLCLWPEGEKIFLELQTIGHCEIICIQILQTFVVFMKQQK